MNKLFSHIGIIFLLTSCSTSKEFQIPMTEKMYQESRLEKKQMRKVNKKNFLKNYTADFVNSIPEKDLNLLTVDTIVVVYDSIIVRYDNFQ
jgi:hypothetical protein